MRKFGLIGYPLSHSFSPGYFAEKFKKEGILDARYDLYPIPHIDDFQNISEVEGLNVTIPYKEEIIPYLDELSEEAQMIGAVNTIVITPEHQKGFNTDAYGFERSLIPLWKDKKPESALVLGTGGAAKAVWYVLDKLGIEYLKISRTDGDLQYDGVDETIIKNNKLIVNTTPLGMAPNLDSCPNIPYDAISSEHILYDLVYNPEKTLFLIKGADQGATIKNGLEMLQLQAEKAWDIWNMI